MTITQQQDEIIQEFSLLEGDAEMSLTYLMEVGQRLPPIAETDRVDENIVKGCQSKVWLTANDNEGKVYFHADSNTAITKGLVSLLLRVLSGQRAEDILNTELYFMEKAGLSRFIGTQRSNGFVAMIKQIKYYALVFKTKESI